jgi:uncharacterized protein (DUF697 family)
VSLNPLSILKVARELKRGTGPGRPLGVAGARELVPLLARELREGGLADAVAEQQVEGIAALVWVGDADEDRLRAAAHANVPIVAVTDAATVPYVLAEDIIGIPPGQGFPIGEIAKALADRMGEQGAVLASRLPVLRSAVCKNLISSYSKKNGFVGAAVFIPGVDLPVLTLNQVRLVLWIAVAYGEDVDRDRAVELIGVVGAGFGLRAAARELLDFVPVAGWAVKGAVAYTGTRAIGEAAVRYFEARAVRPGS